jgi:hypothetical protein
MQTKHKMMGRRSEIEEDEGDEIREEGDEIGKKEMKSEKKIMMIRLRSLTALANDPSGGLFSLDYCFEKSDSIVNRYIPLFSQNILFAK